MALLPLVNIAYKENLRESEKLEFVHEVTHRRPRTYWWKPHEQDYYEIIIFNSGMRDIMIGDRIYNCSAGDIILLTPEEVHVGRSYDCLLDRYVLQIGREVFSCFGEQGRQLLRIFTDREPYTGNHIRLMPDMAEQLNALLADTDKTLKMGGEGAMMEAFADIVKILLLLNRAVYEPDQTASPSRTLLQILAYMDTNYAVIENIEEICREFGVSRSGMWRMFREHLQQTPGEYLRNLRMQHARYVLEQGGNVTEVSAACGFADCSHFIRLFRERYGMTPYRYRTEYMNQSEKGDNQ